MHHNSLVFSKLQVSVLENCSINFKTKQYHHFWWILSQWNTLRMCSIFHSDSKYVLWKEVWGFWISMCKNTFPREPCLQLLFGKIPCLNEISKFSISSQPNLPNTGSFTKKSENMLSTWSVLVICYYHFKFYDST